jgi:hypothetical protein
MPYTRGVAVTGYGFGLLTSSGTAVTTGTVTGYITQDGGVQSFVAGAFTHEGQGQWTVDLSASEMDADVIVLTFVNAVGSAVPLTRTIKTVSAAGAAAAATPGSTLDQGLGDLQAAVGHFLGYTSTSANWSAVKLALIDSIVQSGLRRFYWPPPLPGQMMAHEWSWIKPTATLTTAAPYSTGTVTIVDGVVTLVTGTWPSWAASGVIKVSGLTHAVDTRDSDSQLTLHNTSLDAAALTTYVLSQLDYDLPSDFGHLEGGLTFAPNLHWPPIQVAGEGLIRQYRQSGSGDVGVPRYAAVRAKTVPDSTSVGQRFEVMFDKAPDAAYVLAYRYAILPDRLTTTNAMPYGGIAMAETLLESCLSVAEERVNDTRGVHYQAFIERLAAAISFDSRNRPDTLGYHWDRSDDCYAPRPNHLHTRGVAYNGVVY